MGEVTRAKKRRLEEELEECLEDHFSRLPDAVVGDIISLLPTKDGASTQVLSSRWRHLWRSAPLNVDIRYSNQPFEWRNPVSEIPRILSSHPGPGRRFAIHFRDVPDPATTLDGWLQSPALHNLQQLEFLHGGRPPPLPASVHRFSSTLRIASFGGFCFPDGDGSDASALRLPLLQQLTLVRVTVSEGSLRALLAGCPALESLLLLNNKGFRRLRIVSPSLRSIGVRSGWAGHRLKKLVVKDTPCLERLLFLGKEDEVICTSVISAPRLHILGKLFSLFPLLFGTTKIEGASFDSFMAVVHGVKVLALSDVKLHLCPIIDFINSFPHLETLYIKATHIEKRNEWLHWRKQQKLVGDTDIRLRNIVLRNYLGNRSHINFAKFFVSKARVLESMRLELGVENASDTWIEGQHRLLGIEKRASKGARFDFVSPNTWNGPLHLLCAQQVHDLSTDPFQKFH